MLDWPNLSGAEVVRALERLGFAQARQRGSHIVMRKGTQGCVAPLHRIGTLSGLVRQAGVDAGEFLTAVKKT